MAGGCGGFDIGAGDVAVFRVGYAQADQSDGCYPNDLPPPDEGDSSNLRSGQTLIVYGAAEGDADPIYYFDAGGLVLEGSQGEDGAYTFNGEAKDVQPLGGQTITDADHDGLDDYSEDPSVDADGDGLDDLGIDTDVDADGDGLDDRGTDDFVDTNGDGVHDYNPVELPAETSIISTTKYSVSMTVTEEGVSGTFSSTTSTKCTGLLCGDLEDDEPCKQSTTFQGVWVEEASVDASLDGGNPSP